MIMIWTIVKNGIANLFAFANYVFEYIHICSFYLTTVIKHKQHCNFVKRKYTEITDKNFKIFEEQFGSMLNIKNLRFQFP